MAFVQNLFSPNSSSSTTAVPVGGGGGPTPSFNNNNNSSASSIGRGGRGGGAGISSQLSSFLPPANSLQTSSSSSSPTTAFDRNQMQNGSFNTMSLPLNEDNGNDHVGQQQQQQQQNALPLSPSLYPEGHPLSKGKLTPFSTRLLTAQQQQKNKSVASAEEEERKQKQEEEASMETKKWLEKMPTFSHEKRFRPSDTWAAVSPNFPNLADVFPEEARKREQYHKNKANQQQHQNRMMMTNNYGNQKQDEFFSDFAFTGDDFTPQEQEERNRSRQQQQQIPSAVPPSASALSPSRSRSPSSSPFFNINNDQKENNHQNQDYSDDQNQQTNAIDYYRSMSQQRQKSNYHQLQQQQRVVGGSMNNNNNDSFASRQSNLGEGGAAPSNEEVEDFRLRSASMVSAVAAARVRSFTGGSDFENNPFATRYATNKNNNRSASSSGTKMMRRQKGQRDQDDNDDDSSSQPLIIGRGSMPAAPPSAMLNNNNNDSTIVVDSNNVVLEEGDDENVLDEDDENPWIKNVLLSLGSTANPQSQRLFTGLAPERLAKERQQMSAEELQRQVPNFNSKAKIRGANNLLPPTPFSNTVPVLKGSLPNWIRRCDPARDLDAAKRQPTTGNQKARRGNSSFASKNNSHNNNNNNNNTVVNNDSFASNRSITSDRSDDLDFDFDDESSSDDDDAIFDEFLRKEKDEAKNEKPTTERRGDFYRLNLQKWDQTGGLKISETAPVQQKDPNEAALEFLAVSRPEFAPALRRLAPWQLQLIDWTSLFSGGTHQDVSVTAKRFPAGAAWEQSPFSEAPTSSGTLGFVGNLSKREKESDFFSKLHTSNDGRVDDEKLKKWLTRQPIRFTVHDNPV